MGNLEQLFLYIYTYGYIPVIIHSESFLSRKKLIGGHAYLKTFPIYYDSYLQKA